MNFLLSILDKSIFPWLLTYSESEPKTYTNLAFMDLYPTAKTIIVPSPDITWLPLINMGKFEVFSKKLSNELF